MSVSSSQFELTDSQFGWVCKQVKDRTGIHLTESKRNLVFTRLASRLRRLGLAGFDDYFELLEQQNTEEFEEFVNAITTNVTSFFREEHHFDFLRETALPEMLEKNKHRKRLRIWSAGCSLGMEPYSIAMVLRENVPTANGWDVTITATDLDTKVLETAAAGIYDEKILEAISEERRRKFVYKGTGSKAGRVKMRPEISSLISFHHLNLMAPWSFDQGFDIIFCRNVVIYFDRETQIRLWARFGELLPQGGYLFVGHSESMLGTGDFEPAGRTIYRKTGGRS